MTDRIDSLIATLSQSPAPRKALRPGFIFGAGIGIGFGYVGLLLLTLWHPRPDLAAKLAQPLFIFEILALAATMAGAILSVVLLAFPDTCQRSRLAEIAPAFSSFCFVIALAVEYAADIPPVPEPAHNIECCLAITGAALPLAACLFVWLRRMAPTRPRAAGAAATLAALSAGALALRLSEPTDSLRHLVLWHYAPMFAMSLAGIAIGRRFLKW